MESGKLRLSGNGLRAQAGWCGSLADSLAGNNPPSGVGSSSLASSAAVSVAHTRVTAAGVRCTFRLHATATKLSGAAVGYDGNDVGSAARLRALGPVAVA